LKLETHKDLFKHRDYALSLPGAVEDFPHGHSVIKVGKKVFAFLGQNEAGRPSIALKLPQSFHHVLNSKAGEPTEYGLGRHGWATIEVDKKNSARERMIKDWIQESYRAIAPKKLIAELDGLGAPASGRPRAALQRGSG
jgi:predicted DNA-binding protein (MmcQ/YjbR family)